MVKPIGRKEILTSYANIENSEQLLKVLKNAISAHNENEQAIIKLENYYKGIHPVLKRRKDIRADIKNNVVRPLPYAIVEFKKGYEFGNTIQYIQKRGKIAPEPEEISKDNKVTGLNDIMSLVNKRTKDIELAEDLFISGVAYRSVLPRQDNATIEDAPFYLDVLDPKDTFVVKFNGIGKKTVLGCLRVKNIETGKDRYCCYTENKYFEVENNKVVSEDTNGLGMIPIIQYRLNPSMIGCFEPVLSEVDALNTMISNRVDYIEQVVQAILVFTNCDIDEEGFAQLKKDLAVKVKGDVGMPADVKYITAELNQNEVQTSIDDMHQNILSSCNVPDRNASAGGNTGAALQVAEGWAGAESQAKADIIMFEEAEREMLKVVKKIVDSSTLPYECKGVKISNIDINADREKNQNLLTKTQGLLNLLEAGVEPVTACASVGLFNDPQLVADTSPNMAKWSQQKTSDEAIKTNAKTEDVNNDPNNATM